MMLSLFVALAACASIQAASVSDADLVHELSRLLARGLQPAQPSHKLTAVEKEQSKRKLDNLMWQKRYEDAMTSYRLKREEASCSADEFKCTKEDRCLHDIFMCDGKSDCWEFDEASGEWKETGEDEELSACSSMGCTAPESWDWEGTLVRCPDGACKPEGECDA